MFFNSLLMDVDDDYAEGKRKKMELDVEERLDQANCFKKLLNRSFFNDDEYSDIEVAVESKIKEFIRFEMRLLMGLETKDESKSVFTKDEIEALKFMANKLMNNKDEPLEHRIYNKPSTELGTIGPVQEAAPVPPPPGKFLEKIVTLPNGEQKVIRIPISNQVKPPLGHPGYIPPAASFQDVANMATMSAQVQASKASDSGLFGTIVSKLGASGVVSKQEE